MAKLNNSRTVEDLNDEITRDVMPVTVFIGLEMTVGFVGNILILLVYSKRYKRVNFRYFVLALAIVDFTSCCTTLPGEIVSQLNWYNYEHGSICKVKSYFNVFTAWASATILLSLAIDRYRKICHPFHWQISFNNAFRLCGCCFLVSALVAIPVAVLWGKQTYDFNLEDETVTVSICEKSGEYANTIYPLAYIVGVYLVPVSIIIIVAMTLNFITARRLFSQTAISKLGKDNLGKSMTPKALATGSSDRVADVNKESTLVSATSLEDNCIQHADSKVSINNSDFASTRSTLEIQESRDNYSDNLNMNNSQSIQSKHNQSPVVFFANKAYGTHRVTNSIVGNCSIDDESSVDCYSRSSKNNETLEDHISKGTEVKRNAKKSRSNRRSKTLIMLVLTSIFAVTMVIYIILTSLVAKPDGILKDMPGSEKAVFFFFWRLYFINSVVNPILYGFMDPRFRSGLMSYLPKTVNSKISSSTCST